MIKNIISAMLAAVIFMTGTACGNTSAQYAAHNDTSSVTAVSLSSVQLSADDYYFELSDEVNIDLSNGIPDAVTSSGTYRFSGKLEGGSINVNVDKSSDKGTVFIILDNADITSADIPPINITEAKKVVVILENGSHNKLTHTLPDTQSDGTAALYSKADLTLTGNGTLEIEALTNDGINSRDDLIITDGTYMINAAGDGIVGKDMVVIEKCNMSITAGKDGIRSTNEEDEEKGFIVISGGEFNINSADDCIQAVTLAEIKDGSFTLTAYDAENAPTTANAMPRPEKSFDFGGRKGRGEIPQDGKFTPPEIPQGERMPDRGFGGFMRDNDNENDSSSPKGITSIKNVVISGGSITINASFEGIEGENITIDGGDISITSSDDGINVNVMGGDFTMNGGTIRIYAGGDGIDSNGTITHNGGEIIIDTSVIGPADTPIDYETDFVSDGGSITDTEGNAVVASNMPFGRGMGGRGGFRTKGEKPVMP